MLSPRDCSRSRPGAEWERWYWTSSVWKRETAGHTYAHRAGLEASRDLLPTPEPWSDPQLIPSHSLIY